MAVLEQQREDEWVAGLGATAIGPEPARPRAQVRRHRLVLLIPVGLGLIVLAMIVLAANRGFSFADEAFYYSLIENGTDAPAGPFTFHLLLNPVFEALGSTVLSFRILRIVGYVVVAVFVGLTVGALLKQRGFSGWWLGAFPVAMAVVGLAWSWSFPPPAVSYNELAIWSSVLAAGLALLSHRTRTIWSAALLNVAAGGALSIAVLNKFASGVLILLYLGGVLLLLPGAASWARKALNVGCLLAGLAISLFTLSAVVPVRAALSQSVAMLGDPSQSEAWQHGVDDMLAGLLSVPFGVVSAMNLGGWLMVIGALALFGLGARRLLDSWSGAAPWSTKALMITAVLVGLVPIGLEWRIGDPRIVGGFPVREASMGLCLAIALVLMAIAANTGRDPEDLAGPWEVWLPMAALSLVPLLASVGTNNSLLGHAIYGGFVWFAVLGGACGLLLMRATDAGQDYFVGATIAGFGLAGVAAAFSGTWLTPYLQDRPLIQQDVYSDSPLMRGIRLSGERAQLVDRLAREARAKGFSARGADARPVIAIGDDLEGPGRLLFFNNSAFAYPFLLSSVPGTYESVRQACNQTGKTPYVLAGGPGALYSMRDATLAMDVFQSCGNPFPDGYESVRVFKDRGTWTLGIWKPLREERRERTDKPRRAAKNADRVDNNE